MSILNKTNYCDCGGRKDTRRQWCTECYNLLTMLEREEFAQNLAELRAVIALLQKRLAARRRQDAEADGLPQ